MVTNRRKAILDVIDSGGDETMLLAGASNMDLAVPGSNSSLSLALATVELLSTRVGMDELVSMEVIMTLSREAGETFASAGAELDERIAAELEADARQQQVLGSNPSVGSTSHA